MATIALYAGKLNEMPGLLADVRKSVVDYQAEMSALRNQTLKINKSVCNLDGVISKIQASTRTQEEKSTSLEVLQRNSEQFIEDVAYIDSEVADMVKRRKDDFYDRYYYLKPDDEKNGWEKFCDACVKTGEWCIVHWKEILVTITIVIGAVFAIVVVISTGGMALVPLLTTAFTAIGATVGTATTIATCISLFVAVVAVSSTVASSTLNIMDTWGDYSENSTFRAWQIAMNGTCMITNTFYSFGNIYNSAKGISNAGLREYSRRWITNGEFRSIIFNADNYNLIPKPNTSTFWAGLGEQGENIARDYATSANRSTLEMTLDSQGIVRPSTDLEWWQASSSYAMRTYGNVEALLGKEIGSISSSGKIIGNVWMNYESVLLNINPYVTEINNVARGFRLGTLLFNVLPEAGMDMVNLWFLLK